MTRWTILFAALLACAAAAHAGGEVRVISARPESVSVTIYRDFLALITETRTVELPAEPVTLRIEGVIDSLLPQSAVISGSGRSQAESNYDYDALTPGNLMRKSVGRQVNFLRTDPVTGRQREVSATVLSVQGGVILKTREGNEVLRCSGLPERLTLDDVPPGLQATPTLSVKLAGGAPGRRIVQVSYIATGFSWNADYVAHLADGGQSMQFTGWITLHNFTQSDFLNAQVQLVAGRLNLLALSRGGSSEVEYSAEYDNDESIEQTREQKLDELRDRALRREGFFYERISGCYPLGKTTEGLPGSDRVGTEGRRDSLEMGTPVHAEELDEIVIVHERHEAERESLADYQMYRLPWSTDLRAQQSKQVAFLHKDAVKIERFYRLRVDAGLFDVPDEARLLKPDVMTGWLNDQASGLGEPLPAGHVRMFEHVTPGAREVFAGEARLKDSPAGMPVELATSLASHLLVKVNPVADPGAGALLWAMLSRKIRADLDYDIENDKDGPVTIEIRQPQQDGPKVALRVSSALPYTRKFGDYAWRITVPANSTERFSYRISGKVPREEY